MNQSNHSGFTNRRRFFQYLAMLGVGGHALLRSGALKAADLLWMIEGRAIAVDNCVIGCPCLLGEPPTHPTCRVTEVMQVDKGHFADVNLDGTSFAYAAEFSKASRESAHEYHFTAFYIDSGAAPEQRRALRKVLTYPPYSEFAEPAEIREVPIDLNMEAWAKVGQSHGATVGNVARIEVSTIAGGDPREPLVLTNGAPGFPWVAVGESVDSFYRSAGKNFSFDGTSGESFRFELAGRP
jgi:hypothetical protein